LKKCSKTRLFELLQNWKALFNQLGDFFLTVLEYDFSEKNIFRPIVTLKKNDRLILSESPS
jgi:hypothetical protein